VFYRNLKQIILILTILINSFKGRISAYSEQQKSIFKLSRSNQFTGASINVIRVNMSSGKSARRIGIN
jgi:hypothetical protein